MNASIEILSLLQEILDGKCDRSSLARWLAQRSLRFLQSYNEVDRMVVADLDAALGEVQRGAHTEELLVETADLLVKGLHLTLPSRETIIDLCEPSQGFMVTTGTANQGGTPMAAVELEAALSAA